jgi:hypothetical protein
VLNAAAIVRAVIDLHEVRRGVAAGVGKWRGVDSQADTTRLTT